VPPDVFPLAKECTVTGEVAIIGDLRVGDGVDWAADASVVGIELATASNIPTPTIFNNLEESRAFPCPLRL
jgi:hypothetical protein